MQWKPVKYYPGILEDIKKTREAESNPAQLALNESEHEALSKRIRTDGGILRLQLDTGLSAAVIKAALALERVKFPNYQRLVSHLDGSRLAPPDSDQ